MRSQALCGVQLEIDTGVVGLLGPNRAGKTTLLRILATSLSPTSGTVRVLGLTRPTPAAGWRSGAGSATCRRRSGSTRTFTVFDFVDYIAILKELDRRARRDEVRRVLDAVDLGDVASMRIRKLSGRMRRRVILAQSCSASPTCSCSTSRPSDSTPSSACASVRSSPSTPNIVASCCRRT